jgi:ankyrin repeat protein
MKSYKQYNESVRDKMTPKSVDDILKNVPKFTQLYNDVKSWTKKMVDINVSDIDYDTNGTSYYIYFKIYILDNVSVFGDYGRNALMVKCYDDEELFLSLKKRYSSEWESVKYRADFSDVIREMNKLRTANESLRDKMTPKSDEEIRRVIKKIIGMDGDYIEVKIPEPKEPKKIKSLLELSDKYNLDIQDYDDNNVIVCGDITDIFNFIKFYVNYTLMNKRNSRDFFIDYIIKNKVGKITESVRDKMTPKSEEDLLNYAMGLTKEELDLLLTKSVCGQQIPLIKIALQAGANPNALDPKVNLSVLYHAVVGGITVQPNKEIIKMLLDAGADPTLPSKRGLTPLNHAKTWNKDIYEFLLQYMKTNEGVKDLMTPINRNEFIKRFNDYSTKFLRSKREMVNIIIDNFDTNEIEEKINEFIDSFDMMVWTSDKGEYGQVYTYDKVNVLDKKQLKELFNRLIGNTNESIRDKMIPKSEEEISNILKNKSPQQIFQIAVNLNDSELVEYAFKETFKENKNNIAILYPERISIILNNEIDVFKVVIKYQPNVIYSMVKDAIDDGLGFEIKPFLDLVDVPRQELLDKLLVYCCTFNVSKAVKILVELGADIHYGREEALMQATFSGHRFVIKELLKFGADPTIDDNKPIKEAQRRKYFDIVSIMKSYVRKMPLKKRLSKYLPFLKESLRDKMTPKSKEDIKNVIDNLLSRPLDIKRRFILMEMIAKRQFNHRNGDLIRSIDILDFNDEQIDDLIKRYYLDNMLFNESLRDIKGVGLPAKVSEGVRDKMAPKSEVDIKQAIEKSLNRYPNLGTFNYKKYSLTITEESDLNENIFRMIDKNNNHWFMQLEFFAPGEGRIYIYAYPPNSLRTLTHARFYSYKELEDFLDEVYKNEGI